MYNTFSSNSNYYQRSILTIPKSNQQQRFEQTFPFDRLKDTKVPQWNIEEYKENITLTRDRPYTASMTQLPKSEFSGYQNSDYTVLKDRQKQTHGLTRSKGTASTKAIKFLVDLQQDQKPERPYSKKAEDYKSYSSKKDNLKSITMSLDYKSSLKDLLPNFKYGDYKSPKEAGLDKSLKNLNSYKSMTKIGMNLDEVKSSTKLDIPRSNYEPIKSYKDLADKLNDYKFKKQDKTSPVFTSEANIPSSFKNNLEQYHKLRNETKKSGFNQDVKQDKISSQLKKNQTGGILKIPSSKCITSRNKLSINDFQLGKCLGQGAFGQVFPAIHKATKMLVAIKKVSKEKVKYMLDQFINQIKIQMFLEHPNVVKLYGFFDDTLNFYIIMEYMQGGNLFALIKKQKKLSESQASERLKQICTGLKQMHDNSILHRDIKPENIVITNDVCKLCDLGWAAICKDRRTTYCGTLDYVSPQIIGGQGYDDSVDIWCVGVLAYEMICGKTPFYNISRKQTMKRIVDVNYEYPSEVSSKAKAFIDKILKKNPDDRFDIDEVLKDKFLQ